MKVGSTSYACANTAAANCQYEQLTTAAFPAVTSVSLASASTQIVFTGTNFFTTGYTANAAFMGVPASSVSIDSSTQVTATWAKGVPVSASATSPALYFNSTSSSDLLHYASIASTATLTNVMSLTQSSTAVSCSFAGGCLYSVSAPGLSSLLAGSSSENNITVCDNLCSYSDTDSTASIAQCKLPAMSTVYSNANYLIA